MIRIPFLRFGRVPFVPQMETSECGIACLAMILAYHGHWAPIPELRDACGAGREGTSGETLVQVARARGLDSVGLNLEVADLRDLPLPGILHWEFSHFVVLERVESRCVVILDPALGRMAIGLDRLRRCYTGVALAFEPGSSFRPRPRSRPSLRSPLAALRGHEAGLIHLILASLSLHFLELLIPIGQQLLVDRVILPGQRPWLWGLTVAMTLALLVRTALSFTRDWVAQNLETVVNVQLIRDFLCHLVELPLGFFLLRQPGDLVQRTESAAALGNLMGGRAFTIMLDLLLLSGYMALMAAYHIRLGMLIVGLALVQLGVQLAYRRSSRQALAEELGANGRSSAKLLEALDGVESIKAMGAETATCARWSDLAVQALNARLRRQGLALTATAGRGLVSNLGTAAIFALAGREVLYGAMSLGTFSAFLVLEGLFVAQVADLAESLGQFQVMGSHLARLEDVYREPVAVTGSLPPPVGGATMIFHEVGFRHRPGEPPVLSGLTLTIRPGEKIALVGPNGSGKTTFALLLAGLLHPSEGRIICADRELAEYDLSAYRRSLGIVLQDAFLLDDTIRANLALQDSDLPTDRLQEATEAACIHDFVASLPDGYETRIGENGTQLSGGQRQRLVLARALIHQPWMLILDEATRSLDSRMEARILANLTRRNCTCLFISHRAETLHYADRIVALEGGRLTRDTTATEWAEEKECLRRLLMAEGGGHG